MVRAIGLRALFRNLTSLKLLWVTTFILSSIAFPGNRGVKFKDPLVLPQGVVGSNYSVDLRTLLADPGVAPYRWGASNLPDGLVLDEPNNLIKGTPTAAGTFNPRLTVKDSTPEGADLNHPASLKILPPPPEFTVTDLDLGVTKEGDNLTVDLTQYLTDPQSAQSFSATGLPSWLTLEGTTGKLSGVPPYTPNHQFAGPYSGIVIKATNSAGSSTITARGNVLKKIVPPKWAANPIALADAFEDTSYSADTAQHVVNPEGATIRYTLVSQTPPPWLNVGANTGTIFGTPKTPGNIDVVLSLSAKIDGITYTDSTTFKFKVIHVNHPPKWLANPIILPKTTHGTQVTQPLSNSATDPDAGDKLTFSLTGPDWARIDTTTGVFSGKPGKSNLGLNKFVATVTDQDGAKDTTEVQIFVEKANEPPVWNNHPTLLPDAAEDKNYGDVELSKFVTDPDGDRVYFSKISGPAWLQINENGTLSGAPGAKDVGINTFSVRVSDRISTPDDISEVQLLVVHTNHLPYWTINPMIYSVPEESSVSQSIAQYAKDSDNDPLTFALISGPSWAKLDAKGTFTGTPQMSDEGDNTFKVAVADASGELVQATVIFKVLHVNHPPKWTQNPIILPNATEDANYNAALMPFVIDVDLPNDTLRIIKISASPSWLTVAQDGTITGRPRLVDAGKTHSFQVRVFDAANTEAVTTVQITVDKINHAPRWSANPIPLNDAYEDTTYSFPLNIYASDIDGDTLTFEKVDGPNWMMVSSSGAISGIPTQADIGDQIKVTFKVTDPGGLSATTEGVIKVIHKNHPPTIGALPQFNVKEREVAEFDLKNFVQDSDNDPVNFVLVNTSDCGTWVKLSAEGKLTLDRPKRIDVGSHDCNFKVDDGNLMAAGTLKVVVEKNPRAPIWLNEPIANLTAKTNETLSESIANLARDLDGEVISFSKVEGKDWLTLSSNGILNATPKEADLGSQEFKLRVTNEDGLYSDGTLVINVVPGTQVDNFTVDTSGPAKTELLWIIDNSKYCDSTIKALKNHIDVFYGDLNSAQVSHENILLSTDVEKFKGLPIAEQGGLKLFGSETQNLIAEFQKRVGLAGSFSLCNNCRNSPIWSMFRFYEQLPTEKLADIYHKGYMMRTLPMDALIVTHQLDHFKYYTSKLPEPLKSYTANDFARDFVTFHKQERKGYRVSAIAPGCPSLISSEPDSAAPSNAYNTIVQKTNGKYYVNQCQFDMERTLHDYAKDVIFRAKVHGNNPFTLSKRPLDLKTLKVSVGNVALIGNTGSSTDQWTYEANSNAVTINWDMINTSQLSISDRISIEYRVSR
ncbi:MAG: tandem-95 repeat protein [Deltaproteobacteria bacterium]|nr:tandem-95 repeat protein [Deltaproteobacteria bacterium]